MSNSIKPRNDFCVIRMIVREDSNGIKLPQNSPEGKDWFVEAIGPKVEGLKIGDKVEMTGQKNVDWSYVPRFPDLIIIRQENIVLIYES